LLSEHDIGADGRREVEFVGFTKRRSVAPCSWSLINSEDATMGMNFVIFLPFFLPPLQLDEDLLAEPDSEKHPELADVKELEVMAW